MACRINKTYEWSTRLVYEMESHDKACFITLTYDPMFLPENGSLVIEDIQKFNKRVRKKYYGNTTSKYKFYICGEYGPTTFRPHYHGALFGVDFEPEEWILFKTDSDGPHYTSPALLKLWPFGFNEVGLITPTRMNYVTGYIQKKLFGDGAKEYEDRGVIPPFQLFSKNLGLEALKRDADRLTRLYLSDQGKHLQKYYSTKLAFNEIKVEYNFEEFGPHANMIMTLGEARQRERLKKERAKYPDLSDVEYAQMIVSKRLQAEVDIETKMKILNVRGKL